MANAANQALYPATHHESRMHVYESKTQTDLFKKDTFISRKSQQSKKNWSPPKEHQLPKVSKTMPKTEPLVIPEEVNYNFNIKCQNTNDKFIFGKCDYYRSVPCETYNTK